MGSNMHGERSETCIQILPDGIIFEILLLLPGDILYNVVRYVCRNWCKIIEHPEFVSKHHMLSPCTLLSQHRVLWLHEYGLSHGLPPWIMSDPEIQLLPMETGFRVKLPPSTPEQISSCNGLLLWKDKEVENIYYVGNPVTRRVMPLPPFPEFMRCPIGCKFCCLAFAASYKAYKVLVVYQDLRFRVGGDLYRRGCSILTVGIDKAWRELNLTHVNEDDINFFVEPPVSTTGIIYWAKLLSSYILALDVESECIKRIQLPCAYKKNNYLLPKGNSITFWQDNQDLSMEVWVLKDNRTEEWVKLLHLESEPIRYAIERFLLRNKRKRHKIWLQFFGDEDPPLNGITIQPRGWLENIESVILYTDGRTPPGYSTINTFLVFDLKARTCTSCRGLYFYFYRITPFINSLAWI